MPVAPLLRNTGMQQYLLVKQSGHIGEALGDGLDVEVRAMKLSTLITPRFLAPTAG